MAKKLKRAFTITELVIVIAVVAILAAVLIPTFANVVDKAHESADTQAVRNMNTSLQNDEVINGKPYSPSEAMQILAEAGLNAQDYHALQGGTAIYYNKYVNRMIYVRLNDEGGIGKVIFPEEYASSDDDSLFWSSFYLLSGRLITDKNWLLKPGVGGEDDPATKEQLEADKTSQTDIAKNKAYYDGDKLIGAAIADYNGLLSIAEYIETTEDGAKGFTVLLGQDIDMTVDGVVQEWKPIANFAGDFYGRGHKISNLKITDASADSAYFAADTANANYSFYGFISVFTGTYFGNVTIEVNSIDEPGSGVRQAAGYNQNNHTVAGAIGAVYATGGEKGTSREVKIEKVTVTTVTGGSIVGVNRVAGVVGFIGGYSADTDDTSKYPANSTITIKECHNKADIISNNRSAATFSTAAGIVSTSNQTASGVKINIEKCTNTGNISGMWVGGIMADAWRSSDKDSTATFADVAGKEQNIISITDCSNSGDLLGVCPVITGDPSSVVVGGIFGAFNGYRNINYGSKENPNYNPGERFGLEITGCTNTGKIVYQYNSGFKGNICLADIVSLSRALASQNAVSGFSSLDSAGTMATLNTGDYVPRQMKLSGNNAAENSGFYEMKNGSLVKIDGAPSVANSRTITVLSQSPKNKLYIDFVGATKLDKNTNDAVTLS